MFSSGCLSPQCRALHHRRRPAAHFAGALLADDHTVTLTHCCTIRQNRSFTIQTIPISHLIFAGVPALIVVFVLWRWSVGAGHSIVALARMVAQLLIVGYLLVYIFEADVPWIVLAVLTVMVLAASWIALRTIPEFRRSLYGYAFLAILIGGGLTVVLITQAVLTLDPWYEPSFMVPLSGMIFAASMNSVSLAAERMLAELKRGASYIDARRIALQAGLIPIVNTLFAVGLVSLPGLMTGQILSGVSPMVAVRYQVMVMCMVFGASGMSAAIFLLLLKRALGHELDSKGSIVVKA